MSKTTSSSTTTDLPLIPAVYMAMLAFGAAVHAHPTLLRPIAGLAHSLSVALLP